MAAIPRFSPSICSLTVRNSASFSPTLRVCSSIGGLRQLPVLLLGDLGRVANLLGDHVGGGLFDHDGRARLDCEPLMAGGAEESPRGLTDRLVVVEGQPDDLCARGLRALADERRRTLQTHLLGRSLDALIRLPERRLVQRNPLLRDVCLHDRRTTPADAW